MYPVRLKPDPRFETQPDGTTTDLVALDKDVRELLAKLPQVISSGDVDLSSHATETNQLTLNACAGNATADSVEVLNDIAGYQPVQVSRLFVYNMARQQTGELGVDEGTYIRVCFDVLSRFGVCDEYLWPYDPSKVFTSPSLKAQRQAAGHRIHDYYRIKSEGADRVDDVIGALRAKHPVVFGTQISYEFMQLNSDTPQAPPIGKKLAGGHAMLILGYFEGLGFLVKNSWGSSWGAKGYWIMTTDYLTWSETQDLWVPTLGTDLTT